MSRAEDVNDVVVGCELVEAGSGVVEFTPWWKVVGVRAVWLLWPVLVAVVMVAAYLARASSLGRLEPMVVLMLAAIAATLVVVLFTAVRRRRLRGQFGTVLCGVAVPSGLAAELGLPSRPPIAPRIFTSFIVVERDGSGLALAEEGHWLHLRELDVRVVLCASRGGRIGWASLEIGGQVHRAAAGGRLPLRQNSDALQPAQ